MEKEKKTKGRKFITMVMMYVYAMFVTVMHLVGKDTNDLVSFHIIVVSCMAAYMGANTLSKKFNQK